MTQSSVTSRPASRRAERLHLGQVDPDPRAVAAERVAVRAGCRGNPAPVVTPNVRDDVEGREPHADPEPGRVASDRGHGLGEEPGPAVEVAAVATGSLVRREELVQEVAMAVLHVDEVEARLGRDARGRRVGPDQVVEPRVRDDVRVGRADGAVEQRMAVRDLWCRWAGGARPAARMGELQPDEWLGPVVGRGRVTGEQLGAQRGEVADRVRPDGQLVRVRPAVRAHRDGFATPDESRARQAEAPPSPRDELGRPPVRRAVPALHRQDGPPVRQPRAARCGIDALDRTAEHRRGIRMARQRDAEAREVCVERARVPELAHLHDPPRHGRMIARARPVVRVPVASCSASGCRATSGSPT